MTVDIGLIEAGGISYTHRPVFRDFEDRIRLSGVCDVDKERAANIAEEFGTDHWTDFEVFVKEGDTHAVNIALPHSLHHSSSDKDGLAPVDTVLA